MPDNKLAIAYLGLGSNMGDRERNLENALELLRAKLKVLKVSSFYETEPEGFKEQPLFLNAACQVETELMPEALLFLAKKIEVKLGRKPGFPNAPREIDIDILLYDDLRLETAGLTIPHPRMAQRAFVLLPLAEIAPGLIEPRSGKSIKLLLSEVDRSGCKLWRKQWNN